MENDGNWYLRSQSGEDSALTWAHFDAGRVNSQAGGEAISTGSNTAVLRVGSDIYRHDFGDQRIKVGVMTGSLETGYDLQLSATPALYLQPQFQTIYTQYSQGDHDEANGTRIHSVDSGG